MATWLNEYAHISAKRLALSILLLAPVTLERAYAADSCPSSSKRSFGLTDGGLDFQKDIAFVIDTTAGMSASIEHVKSITSRMINALLDGDTDARIGVAGFKDTTKGERSLLLLPFAEQVSFADRKTAALGAINKIVVGGGRDPSHTAFDSLVLTLDGSMGEWRYGAGTRRIYLFTNAPVKDTELKTKVNELAHNAKSTDPGMAVQIYTIFLGPVRDDTTALQTIANSTGGEYLFAPSDEYLVYSLCRSSQK